MHDAQQVFAVLLVYQLDPSVVATNLESLGATVRALVVVDNSSSRDAARWNILAAGNRKVHAVMNGANAGVAAGWNAGIKLALEQGAEFVLLLDEDSIPGTEMVQGLIAAWAVLAQTNVLAAVGPDFRDRTTGARAIFVSMSRYGIRRRCCSAEDKFLPTDYLMSSGSLVHRTVFDAVGFMDERLFIDYVDTEWCLRARSRGRACFGVCGAHMQHAFGSRPLPVPWGRGRAVPDRTPHAVTIFTATPCCCWPAPTVP